MTDRTANKRNTKRTDKLREQGLVPLTLWCYPEDKAEIIRYANELMSMRERVEYCHWCKKSVTPTYYVFNVWRNKKETTDSNGDLICSECKMFL